MAIKYDKDDQNIVTLTMDMPGRSANVINEVFGAAFAAALQKLQQEEKLTGVIVTSAKRFFMAGADLEDMALLDDAAAAYEGSQYVKAGFRKLETIGVPVAAALNGTAMGGGLELALACHYRIAINNPKAKFGFPEVKLGLLPGGGGIVRLTRMLGLQESFPYLMEGQEVDPAAALRAGIINELADDFDDMIAKAKAWILANPHSKQPWDSGRFKMPGGDPQSPHIVQMLAIAPAMLKKRTFGNYPTPEAIMNAAVEGAMVDFETASRIESRYFAQVATSKVAKNMINTLWFQLNEIKAGASRPQGIEPQQTKKVGVLGAGMMGHGIAYVSAYAGMDVVMKDATLEKAEAGKSKIEAIINKRVARGKMTAERKQEILDRIVVTAAAADLKGCDLIIEAVFEDRDLKAQVTREAEAQIAADAILATNTSTLPITGLARPSARPENFIGLHFFSPVERMPLVEIIMGEKTSEQTLAKAFDYVLQINKTPIVVNDSRGFYTSRVFGTYTREGMALLAEGQHPRAIEMAGLQAGMPVGPLAITDEVNLGLVLHIREQTRKDLAAAGQTMPPHPSDVVIDKMTQEFKRFGKVQGAGFYEYPENGKKYLWPELQIHFPLNGHPKLSQAEMMERLMFIQALETVRCYEENVVRSVADANIGSIFGWSFAPFKGGTLQYINDYGIAEFVARSRQLAETYGEGFNPPNLLVQMAENNNTF